jgi:hypothetical protein
MSSPASRPSLREDLTTVALDGEAIVYDETSGELHHLNPAATIVFSLFGRGDRRRRFRHVRALPRSRAS